MLDNCAIVDIENYKNGANLKGRKPAKLSTFKIFSQKTKELMKQVQPPKTEQPLPQTPVAPPTPAQSNPQVQTNTQVETNVAPTTSVVANDSFSSKEVLEKKAANLNVTFYNDLVGNVKLDAYRRLRVNNLIVKVLKHTKETVALEPEKLQPQVEQSIKNEQPFDFSKISSTTTTESQETEEKKSTSNSNLLDNYKWLREEVNQANQNLKDSTEASDETIVEFKTLLKEKETKEDSLATQKEILENLRKRIEQNRALCEAKKRELLEENMALTQELNDVLAEINQLSDIANQQEAFLELPKQEDSFKKVA